MLPTYLSRQLARQAIGHQASATFEAMFANLAQTLERAGFDEDEATALADDLVKVLLGSMAGASHRMVDAMAARAAEARDAPRH